MAVLFASRLEVAGVVRRVRVPADRVAERGAERQQERAGNRVVGGAGVGLAQDDAARDQEDDGENGEGVPLEDVYQVVAEEGDHDLHGHDDEQAEHLRQVGQHVQRQRAADAVHREPADPGRDRVQPGGQRVAPVTEPQPAQHHLRYSVLGSAPRQDALGDAADRAAQNEGQRRLPEAEAEPRDREHADEDRGELHVRRGPGPEELQRLAVPFVQRDELRAARLDRHDLRAVAALADEDARAGVAAVCDVLILCRHLRSPPGGHDHKPFTLIKAQPKAAMFCNGKRGPPAKTVALHPGRLRSVRLKPVRPPELVPVP